MSDTARAGLFVGMSELYKGYICYYPDTGEFEACINATFDPKSFPLLATVAPEEPVVPAPMPPPLPLPPMYVPVPLGKLPKIPSVGPPARPTPPATVPRVPGLGPPIRAVAPRSAVAPRRPKRVLFQDGGGPSSSDN